MVRLYLRKATGSKDLKQPRAVAPRVVFACERVDRCFHRTVDFGSSRFNGAVTGAATCDTCAVPVGTGGESPPFRAVMVRTIVENMSTETILIIVVLVLLLGGGGFFYSRRGR